MVVKVDGFTYDNARVGGKIIHQGEEYVVNNKEATLTTEGEWYYALTLK